MSGELRVYVGTYTEAIRFGTGELFQGQGQGIHIFRLDKETGALDAMGVTQGVKNPSYVCTHPSGNFLYAVNELKSYEGGEGGTVSAFSVDRPSGALKFLNLQPTRGADPCHVATDASGRHVTVANFTSGSVSVYPIEGDGRLGAATNFAQHEGSSVDTARQAGPHAHAGVFDAENRFLFVPDLGLDKIVGYRYHSETGKIEVDENATVSMKPGAGPRHIVFSPDSRFAYVVNELDSTVTGCSYERTTGRLTPVQSVSTLPDSYSGSSTCADIGVHPSGNFLYASNRGHDSIVLFHRDPKTGLLEPAGHESTQGRIPRSFVIDPTGSLILVANQSSDNIVAFSINASSGSLTPTGSITKVGTPVCVKIVEV
jgi:6-phosphogluconolactonase